MKNWHSIMLAGAISLCTLVSNIQVSKAQSVQTSKTTAPDTTLTYDIYWEYASLDSSKLAEIKKRKYEYKHSRPTKEGIEQYVMDQAESVIYDFQKFFNVKFYRAINFEVDDLRFYTKTDNKDMTTSDDEFNDDFDNYDAASKDNNNSRKNKKKNNNAIIVTNLPKQLVSTNDDMGMYYKEFNLVTITNEESKFLGYSLSTTKTYIPSGLATNGFVRAAMLHEAAHCYIEQLIELMLFEGYEVDNAYHVKGLDTFNSWFIEEGISEYCPKAMHELISPEIPDINSIEELRTKDKNYILRCYEASFVEQIIKDKNEFETLLRTILSNSPPTEEEMLRPEIYISRLEPPHKKAPVVFEE